LHLFGKPITTYKPLFERPSEFNCYRKAYYFANLLIFHISLIDVYISSFEKLKELTKFAFWRGSYYLKAPSYN